MEAKALDEIEARWKSRAEWKRDYEPVGDEDVGYTGEEPVGSTFYTVPDDYQENGCVEYVSDLDVGDALEEARKDIADLIAALRSCQS